MPLPFSPLTQMRRATLTTDADVEDSEVAGLQREIALDAATESAIKSSIETHEKTKVSYIKFAHCDMWSIIDEDCCYC